MTDAHLARTPRAHGEPEGVDPFDVDRPDVEQPRRCVGMLLSIARAECAVDRLGVDPDLVVVAAVDDGGAARSEAGGIVQSVGDRDRVAASDAQPRGSAA